MTGEALTIAGASPRETRSVSGGVEAAKWLAFALMLLDHVTIFVTDERPAWAYLLGRLVFPLFVMSLGYGLQRSGAFSFAGVTNRLLMWAVIAQVPFSFVVGEPVLNVLFTLWGGVFVYEAVTFRNWNVARGFLACALVLCAGFMEFGVVGVVLTTCCVAAYRAEGTPRRLWWGGFWVCVTLLHAINGVPVAMLGPLVFVACLKWIDLPRVRHAFYWLYPAQWVLVAALRAVL